MQDDFPTLQRCSALLSNTSSLQNSLAMRKLTNSRCLLRAELDHADGQIEHGEYVDYEDHSALAKAVHERGLKRLASLRKIGAK